MKPVDVADYAERDYSSYWRGGERKYINEVEQAIVRRLLPRSAVWFADLGCGFGRFRDAYAGRYRNVVMLDYSPSLLEEAMKAVGPPGATRYYFVLADIYRLPFRDHSLDAALMARVYHHLKEPSLALGQIRRALRPGGELVFNYYNRRSLREILRWLFRRPGLNPFAVDHVNAAKDELLYYSHPACVASVLGASQFVIERKLGAGIFHGRLFSEAVHPETIEKILTPLLGRFSLSSLVYLKTRIRKEPAEATIQGRVFERLGEILNCPACGKPGLDERPGELGCPNCGTAYPIRNGMYDFRTAK